MRKLTLFFIFTLLVFGIASGWAEDGAVKRSIVVVFDLSYSMAAIDGDAGLSRHELGVRALKKLFEKTNHEEQWSLIIAEDAEAVATVTDFTSDPHSFIPLLEEQEPWGTTSVDAMVLAGIRRFRAAADRTDRFLLLITDGIHTKDRLYDLREFGVSGDPPVVPVLVGFPISEYEILHRRVSDWITGSGGIFLFHDQTEKLKSILADGRPRAGEGPAHVETDPARAETDPQPDEISGAGYREAQVSFPVWWIFLIPAAGFAGAAAQLFSRWRAKKRLLPAGADSVREVVTLAYSVRDGETESHRFVRFPVKVSGSRKADLVLEKPRMSSGARSFSISKRNDAFEFAANAPLVINGVARRTHLLSTGDRIHFGRYRIVFEGVSHIKPPPPPAPRPGFLLLVPVIAASIALSVLFREPVTIRRKEYVDSAPQRSEAALDHERSTGRNSLDRRAAPGVVEGSGSAGYPGATTAAAIFRTQPGKTPINTFPTVMWEPEVQPDFFKVDALLLHAHPDDETLDYGVLLRRLADSGKRTAVVLFTDGDAGLDQYPWRAVGEGYPAYELEGEELAKVRAEEARSAMAILGVNHYVRLGLRNNPYAGLTDELSTDAVIAAWGGEDQLIERILALILGYRPEIIVSPEPPTAALEHFEHEAVGSLVEAALQKLKREGTFVPGGRLVSVDPGQKGLYPDAVGIRSDGIDSGCELCYRTIQAVALAEYRTQRDASVVGIEKLSGFDREYYRSLFWDLPYSLEEYLASQ